MDMILRSTTNLKLTAAALFLLLLPRALCAATYQAASCVQSDVQAAVLKAVDGDTVVIPGCPQGVAWTAPLYVRYAISLIGAGEGNTVIIDEINDAAIKIGSTILTNLTACLGNETLCNDTGPWRISGMSVAGLAPELPPGVTVGSGGSMAAGAYYIRETYVDQVEGPAGRETTVSSVPANGTLTIASPPPFYTAKFYNVYITAANGVSGTETKQNASPIRIGTSYVQSAAVTAGSSPPGTPLYAVALQGVSHAFRIDHVQFPNMQWDAIFFDDDSAAWGVIDHDDFQTVGSSNTGVLIKDAYWNAWSLPSWTANHAYSVGQEIQDTHGHVQYATVAGLSGATQPSWSADNCGNVGGCSTVDNQATWWDLSNGAGDVSWATPLNLGSNQAVYLENVTMEDWTGFGSSCTDGQGGARFVLRHSTCVWATNHGTESAGRERGGVYMEIYDNTFAATSNNPNVQGLGTGVGNWRSGTGVFFGNNAPGSAYTPGFSNGIVSLGNYRDSDNLRPWGPAAPSAWQPSHSYTVNSYVLDSNLNVEVAQSCSGTCTSGASAPTWPVTRGQTVTDNSGTNQIVWEERGEQNRGACGGNGQFDSNSGTVYASGTAQSGSATDSLATTAESWTTNQWSTGYSLYNVTENWQSVILSNSTSNVTTESGGNYGDPLHTWAAGDEWEILSAYPCLDQIGRANGSLIIGGTSTTNPSGSYPSQAQIPVYIWNNTMGGVSNPTCLNSTGTHCMTLSTTGQGLHMQVNRDFYNAGDNDGVVPGVQQGLAANLPLSCAHQDAYWATDTQTLYQCQGGTFAQYYTPYVYPHPLVEMDPCTQTADRPDGSCMTGAGTATLGR